MKISNIMKIDYVCNCEQPDFSKNYSYWENKNSTSDEIEITNFLKNNFNLSNKKILHIGIGNSDFAKQFAHNNEVFGITVSKKEIELANYLNFKNYHTFFFDKHSVNFIKFFENYKFDYIVDPNLKSYSCCEESFMYMFSNFKNLLNKNGLIVLSRKGMNWYKKLKPKLAFNFKRFFHLKLKETEGNITNILSTEDVTLLSKQFELELYFDKNICYFKKNN